MLYVKLLPDNREVCSKEINNFRENFDPSDPVQKKIMSTELKFDNFDQQNHRTTTLPVSQNETLRIPIYLEASLTISRIVVMVLGVSITLVTLYAGSTIQTAAIRGGVATLTFGLLTWFLNWFINPYSIEEVIGEIASENSEKNDEITFDREA